MFTGIVQTKGKVRRIDKTEAGVRFTVDFQGWQPPTPIRPGDSICCSGVCLTVVGVDAATVSFDVITETLRLTTLGKLAPGSSINLEPSLTPESTMGGHFVQGHIEGVAKVTKVQTGEDWRITFEPPAELMAYIIPKGSVAVDGVSMTVAGVTKTTFELALIPTTLEITTLGEVQPGSEVNVETDIVSRTIVHTIRNMAAAPEGVTLRTLKAGGYA